MSVKSSVVYGDLLSELLGSIRVSSSAPVFFDCAEPWAIELRYDMPVNISVQRGRMWMWSDSERKRELRTGDAFMLPRGTSNQTFYLSSSPDPRQAFSTPAEIFSQSGATQFDPAKGSLGAQRLSVGQGGAPVTTLVTFAFQWIDSDYGPLVEALPDQIFVQRDPVGYDKDIDDLLSNLLEHLSQADNVGVGAIAASTAQLALVNMVRRFALEHRERHPGWLRALRDPRIARALAAMHNCPGEPWTLDELARVASMSRTSFSVKFAALMGQSPFAFLREWRMHLARRKLAKGQMSVAQLAQELGYQSEAAFRSAFRKLTGMSPREYVQTSSNRRKKSTEPS